MPQFSSIGFFQKTRRVCTAVVVTLSVVAVALWFGCKPVYKTRTPRFAEDVKKVAEASELQEWAMGVIRDTNQTDMTNIPQTDLNMRDIPKDRVPTGLRTLISDGSPLEYVFCDEAPGQDRTVWLVWGGGFGHWGIRIGPASFKVDPQDDHYYIEWKPGIYFWHDTH